MRIHTNNQLDQQWRTDYDLLVHPPKEITERDTTNERLEIGSLVRRSDLGNHYGGISMEQYEQIKEIDGIKVAAPLSFLGYLETTWSTLRYPIGNEDYGFYYLESMQGIFDGIRYRATSSSDLWTNGRYYQYVYVEDHRGFFDQMINVSEKGGWSQLGVPLSKTIRAGGYAWSLIAIDPEAEASLLGLDQAIIDGEYLPIQEQLMIENNVAILPFILSNRTYDTKDTSTIYKIEVDESLSVEEMIELGGVEYLKTLPKKEIAHVEINPFSEDLLFFNGDLIVDQNGELTKEPRGFSYSDWRDYFRLGENNHNFEGEFNGSPLYKATPISRSGEQLYYRTIEYDQFKRKVAYDIYGRFNPNQLQGLHTTSKEPKAPDFYNPETVYITHDTTGKPYEQRIAYQPSPYKHSYYTGGVDAITTLTAAKLFNREKPISIIRVVVDGVGERNPVSMAKVERVAAEIRELTGLQVEVMLGAADRKVQILLDDFEGVPGYGYLLEGWSQAGASFVIEDRVSNTNLLLGFYILLIGMIGIFLVYRNYVEVRRKDIEVLYTFGWSKTKILHSLLLESTLLLGIVGLVIVITRFSFGANWEIEQFWMAVGAILLISILAISLLFILPLFRGMGKAINLRSSGEHILHLFSERPSRSLWSYLWRSMLRHPLRSIIKFVIIYITMLYVILFLLAKGDSSADLMLTFLGESINLILEPYQWVLFILGLLLAIVSFLAIEVNQIEKRTRELQLFRAWGWRTRKWLLLYILEEFFISSLAIAFAVGTVILLNIGTAFDQMLTQNLLYLLVITTLLSTLLLGFLTILGRSKDNRLREFI